MTKPRIAMQLVFETALDTGLAGMRGTRVASGIQTLNITGIERADVADGVSEQAVMWIVAHEPGLKVDTRKTRPLNRKIRDLFVAQPELQCDRLKLLAALAHCCVTRDFIGLDQIDRS